MKVPPRMELRKEVWSMSDYNDYDGMNFDPYTGERIVRPTEEENKAPEEVRHAEEAQPAYGAYEAQPEPQPVYETRTEAQPVYEAQPEVQPVYEAQPEPQPVLEAQPQRAETAGQAYFDRVNEPEGERKVYKKQRKAKKQRSPKKGGGFLKKALAAAVLAVIFGAVAGGTFYGICSVTGVWEKSALSIAPVALGPVSDDQTKINIPQLELPENFEGEVKLVNSDNIQVISTDISDMVEEVIPAMVTILNTGKDEYDFWGRSYTSQSSGTGVIIGENETELLIVTNHHVAKDAKQLDITFIDDTTVQAKVKGMDDDMDLAVLAVSLEDIPQETKDKIVIAQLGDSDSLKLGQPAVVIGNALGIGISVTDGIISGLNREMTTEDGKTGTFIQTDAAVNHGNSGGALLNIKGEVIGIVSNKIDGESVEGMGYAIPISAASPIIAELMNRQTRTELVSDQEQGYLGVRLQSVTSEAREYYGLPEGGYVYYIAEGSGAAKAGIQKGDIITKIEKVRVSSNAEAREILQYYRQGEEVSVTYCRLENGEYVTHEVSVVLGAPEVK